MSSQIFQRINDAFRSISWSMSHNFDQLCYADSNSPVRHYFISERFSLSHQLMQNKRCHFRCTKIFPFFFLLYFPQSNIAIASSPCPREMWSCLYHQQFSSLRARQGNYYSNHQHEVEYFFFCNKSPVIS